MTKPLILTHDGLESRFADAYRSLRVTVSATNGRHAPVTVLVASAGADEGRTTTVANLGIVAGQAGSRVLLVDADFRHPSLHQLLSTESSNGSKRAAEEFDAQRLGLTEVIRGVASIEETVVKTPFPGVWLLPAGTDLERPSDILASRRMGEVLRSLREQADLVLIDSAPCLQHVDAIELAAHCDGLLYVVRAGDHDRTAQRQVQAQLLQSNVRMLGVVFNGA
jgi:capsular exopolysaccharide synthesis family protein